MLEKLINKIVSFFETTGGTDKPVSPSAPHKTESTAVNDQITDAVTQVPAPEVKKATPAKKRQFPKKLEEEKRVPVPRKKSVKKTGE